MLNFILISAFVAIVAIGFCLWFFPVYNVWASKKSGEAQLAEAINQQNIQIAEAESRYKAAEANKKAAVVEAEAVALQIEKIGNELTKHDLYLRWQWIRMMETRKGETIYVPTEANLPILEARNKP